MVDKNSSLFKEEKKDYSIYCGVDEAGRGPLAGALVMAGVLLLEPIEDLKDSKKLTAKKREKLYGIIKQSSKYYIYEANAQKIDQIGLSRCLKEGLSLIKKHFKDTPIIFDGNSSFGVDGIETMIKADDKIDCVKAASILAKVYRDNQMVEYSKIYPEYKFEKHKGYGTKAHLEAIAKYGYCKIHRVSFKIKLPNSENSLF